VTWSGDGFAGGASGGSVPPHPPEALSASGPAAELMPGLVEPVPVTQTWYWRYGDAEGRPVTTAAGTSPRFPARADAESWVGEFWRDLVAAGVDTVTLVADDRVVDGPMSLHPVAE
jgi:hypothetical protein